MKSKNQIKYYNKNTFQAAMEMVQDGFFAVYFSQVLEALKEIYGDEYKPEIYETKTGELRYKNDEPYCWSVYKGKIATAICKIIGE